MKAMQIGLKWAFLWRVRILLANHTLFSATSATRDARPALPRPGKWLPRPQKCPEFAKKRLPRASLSETLSDYESNVYRIKTGYLVTRHICVNTLTDRALTAWSDTMSLFQTVLVLLKMQSQSVFVFAVIWRHGIWVELIAEVYNL